LPCESLRGVACLSQVASLDFNHDGALLAVAASYTFEEGEKDHPPDQIYIRAVADTDVKPKPRAGDK